jgi:hypothetical protein
MEPRFGRDFSGVRIHTDDRAAESARQVNSLAYTVGTSIVFRSGSYDPHNESGRRLLAHELTHVVQQSNASLPSPVIRRKPDTPHDHCPATTVADPCGGLATPKELALLAPYSAQASEIEGTLGTLGAVLRSNAPPVERAHLLRIACCQLEPEDAAVVHHSFATRTGSAGRVFHGLAHFTQCALLAILDDRASRVGRAAAIKQQREAEEARQAQIRQAKQREAAEKAQWDRDIELHEKAGRTTWFDVLFPSAARQYRIPYASRIQHPVLKASGELAERAATVSIGAAILEPITHPIEAIVKFFECLGSALRGEDFRALASRFGLKLQAWLLVAFGPGAIVGAVEEAGRMVKQVVKIIIHPIEFAKEVIHMVELLWAPNASELACAMGQDLGAETSKDVGKLATLDDDELAWNLGKLAGPLLLNTMIALVAPEVVGFLKSTRIGKRLLGLLEGMEGKLAFLQKWRRGSKAAGTALKDEARVAEAAEITAGDAVKLLEEHPPVKIEGAPGHRHASLGEGHEVVEVPEESLPGGIACEVHSPGPHPKVPCPKGMGGKRETVAEFEQRAGKITKADPAPPPPSQAEVVHVNDPPHPEGFEDLDAPVKNRKQAGVQLEEDHHIATKYLAKNTKLFKKLGISIDDNLNMIKGFPEHAQLRGWYDWKKGKFEFRMRGHHPDYNKWVTQLLQDAMKGGGRKPDEVLERVTKVLEKLDEVIRANPEVLTYGPKQLGGLLIPGAN